MANLILIFGLAGTGHHLFFDLLIKNNYKNITNELQARKKIKLNSGKFLFSTSSPYGRDMKKNNNVNINEFLLFIENHYSDVNKIVVFLTRDIVDSILSAYNRFYRNYALESFIKIQKKNLIDLKKSYNLIKLNKMIINYENFFAKILNDLSIK